jgi:hypothetical protein
MTAATTDSEPMPVDPFILIGLAGILFTVVGLSNLAFILFPMALGTPEWEFGTYSSLMDNLPLFTMGLGFLAVFAVARAHRVLARILGIVFILYALFIFAGAFLYATNVPLVLRVGSRSAIQTGLKKAVTKGTLQSVVYPIAYLWLGIFSLRHSVKPRR